MCNIINLLSFRDTGVMVEVVDNITMMGRDNNYLSLFFIMSVFFITLQETSSIPPLIVIKYIIYL